MSWLSKYVLNPLGDAFATAVKVGGSASAPAAAAATANLAQAQSLIEGSVTSLATIAVNFVLSLIPKGAGTPFIPLADAFIAEVIAQLQAHQSTATVTVQPPASTVATGGPAAGAIPKA